MKKNNSKPDLLFIKFFLFGIFSLMLYAIVGNVGDVIGCLIFIFIVYGILKLTIIWLEYINSD